MALRIHAICPALNESVFIEEQLRALYPFCAAISVLSQYDRDWYGRCIAPDDTASKVLNFSDPEGKIQFVARRWRDQAAMLNMEMAALAARPDRGVQTHGTPQEQIAAFHAVPDYFLIVDADEIYDVDTLPRILAYLERKRPRGMRVLGYNYVRTWNRRVPSEVVRFSQFGFLRPGIRIKHIRTVSWNESRLSKALGILRLPDFSARLYGFIECPVEVGYFHHGCWLGDESRLKRKMLISAHKNDSWDRSYAERIEALPTVHVPSAALPRNIREGRWPAAFFEDERP